MIRDISQLTAREFDLLVVGAGISGLTIAYDAAQRGLSVALVERDDFGGGASFHRLPAIACDLATPFSLRRARAAMRERRTLARIAPHLLRPLPIVIPIYTSIAHGKLAWRARCVFDRLVARGHNQGVVPALRLPAARVVSRDSAVQLYPGLRRQHLRGAAVCPGFVLTEPDRLTVTFALAAAEHHAVVANYVEVAAPVLQGRRVIGVRAIDRVTGGTFEIRAALTVNATGAAVNSLLAPVDLASPLPWTSELSIVTSRDAGGESLGGRSAAGLRLFLVPWRGRAVFGTRISEEAAPADAGERSRELERFIRELNEAFPSLDLKPADVTLVHQAVVPAIARVANLDSIQGNAWIRDHSADGVDGLLSATVADHAGARAAAERATDLALKKLNRPAVRCRTADVPLPGGDIVDLTAEVAAARREHEPALPPDSIPHLVAAYGTRLREVLAVSDSQPALRRRITDDSPVIGAELIWAARHEMALTLTDVVVRRTPLGALGWPGEAAVASAADIVGAECGWSETRKGDEINALRQFYLQTTSPRERAER